MAEVESRLRQGIAAARSGDLTTGRRLLTSVVRDDPDNELGWIWLASCVTTTRERRACLRRVLEINPNNRTAREALQQLGDGDDASDGAQRGGGNILNVLIALLLIVAVLGGLFLFSSAGPLGGDGDNDADSQFASISSPTPLPPTNTLGPPTATRTPIPFVGTSNAPTLPPTFTPSPTPRPSATPFPSETPFPLIEFELLISSIEAGQTQPDTYRYNGEGAEEVLLLTGARDIAYDPAGERIAFVRNVEYAPDAIILPPQESEGGDEETETEQPIGAQVFPELFIADVADVGNARQITTLQTNILSSPTWSPEGREIVFVNDFDGSEDLWYITPDGENLRRLTLDQNFVDRDPAWEPVLGSRRVLFASDRDSLGITQLYSFEITEPGVEPEFERITVGNDSSYAPAWSPDAALITYISARSGDPDVYVGDPEGRTRTQLTNEDNDAEDRHPTFTPDGRFVAFISNRQDDTFQAYLISVEGDVLVRLTNTSRNDVSVAYKPELLLRLR